MVCGILVSLVRSAKFHKLKRSLDVQIRMGLRCYYSYDDGRLHLLHRSHNSLEVRSPSVYLKLSAHLFVRTRFRREANQADNKAASLAVDSLINYEAVKVCATSAVTQRLSLNVAFG